MSIYERDSSVALIPASAFSFRELADAYNHTRVDYLVPMPMNANRLREYVEFYDVDMAASAVAVDGNEVLGLAMLGVREKRAWITRLGVISRKRRQGTGQMLINHLLEQARQKNLEDVILEVIKNNTPAHLLFLKNGFVETRDFLVLRRPPGEPAAAKIEATIDKIGYLEAVDLLVQRTSKPSWLDEKESMLNIGNLEGFWATLPNGSEGWLVFQNTVFQLGHLVIQTESGDPLKVGQTLLYHLHSEHSAQDTKTENLPADDPHWPAFKELGYMVTFERIEMVLPLKK